MTLAIERIYWRHLSAIAEQKLFLLTWGVSSSVYFSVFYVFMEASVCRTGHFYGTFGGPVCWIILTGGIEVRRDPEISHEGIMAIYFGLL